MVDGNGIANIISIFRSIPAVEIIEHPLRYKASNIFSRSKQILYETGSYKQTGSTFQRHEEYYIDSDLPITTNTNKQTSNERMPDSRYTIFGSQKTSLEDNYDSGNETKSSQPHNRPL